MNSGWILLFLLVTIVTNVLTYNNTVDQLSGNDTYNITVDQLAGNDTSQCLTDQHIPCQELSYVLSSIFNSNKTFVNIEIIGNYTIDQNITINGNPPFIKNITIYSTTKSLINSKYENISFIFNNNNGLATYQIAFNNLKFKRFGCYIPAVIVSIRVPLYISKSTFKDNWCAAINMLDAPVQLHYNTFYNNTGSAIIKGEVKTSTPSFPVGQNSAGGGVAIFFMNSTKLHVSVTNNEFIHNRGVTLASKFVITEGNSFLAFSHVGGGMLLGFLGIASYTKVSVLSNLFSDNEASLGGGLMLAFYNESGYNSIDVGDCRLLQNTASISGGGFAFTAWMRSSHNSINIYNSVISYNFAQVGGGGKVLFQSADIQDPSAPAYQIFTFTNVSFDANEAASASGLHLCYNLARSGAKPVYPVIFNNVTFQFHKNVYYPSARQGPSAYSGVLLSNRVNIVFMHNNYFKNNSFETPVYLSNADLHLKGNLTFLHNFVQTSGGGLSLADVSYVILSKYSMLLFQENYAQVQGGGMFVKTIGFPDMVYKYNPSCFLQYYKYNVPPSQWQVSVKFIKNGAGLKGAAIFSNTITPCIWDEEPPYYSFKKALRWGSMFYYDKNYLIDNRHTYNGGSGGENNIDIATDTTHYDMGFSQGQVVKASPGEYVDFYLAGYDELSNPVYSVPLASSELISNHSNDSIQLTKQYFIVKPNNKENQSISFKIPDLSYEKLKQGEHIVEKIHFIDSYSSFLSNASFIIQAVKCKPGFIYKDSTCVCNEKIQGVVRCDNELVYLKKDYWAYVSDMGVLSTLKCPPRYCQCNFNKTKEGCAFNYLNKDLQCAQNRIGALCGQCEFGTGLNLMTYKCVKCTGFYWSFVVLAIVVVTVVVVSVLVLILNPRFSSHMRGILFFVQMLPYVCTTDSNVKQIILTITTWFGLGGMTSLPINECFYENFNSLDAITLGYVYPVLIFVVLLIIYILHNHRLITFRRDSPFQSFWILIVVMYKFAVETSLLLLFCTPMDEKYVFYFDGSVQCFTGRHLIMTAIAVAVLLLAVIPPIYVILIVKGYMKAGPAITDGLAQGLKGNVRWWWSFDFIRRIAFISVYVFLPDWNIKQTALLISFVIVLTMHSQYKPYINEQANKGETFLLLTLTCLTAIEEGTETSSFEYYLQVALLLLSTIYCLLVALYLSFMFVLKLCRSRESARKDTQSIDFEDSENYDDIEDEIHTTSPLYNKIMNRKKEVLNHRRALPSPTVTRTLLADDFE